MIHSPLSRRILNILFLGFITHIPVKGAESTTYDQHAARRALMITRHIPTSTLYAARSISANNTSNNSNNGSSWWSWMNSGQSSQMNVRVKTEERVDIPIVCTHAEPVVIQVPLANQKTHAVEQSIELESLLQHMITRQDMTWNQAEQAYINLGNIKLANGYGRYFRDGTRLVFLTDTKQISDSFIQKMLTSQITSDEWRLHKDVRSYGITSLSLIAIRGDNNDPHTYYCEWKRNGNGFAEIVDSLEKSEKVRQKNENRIQLFAKDNNEYARLQEQAQKAQEDFKQQHKEKEQQTPTVSEYMKQQQEEKAALANRVQSTNDQLVGKQLLPVTKDLLPIMYDQHGNKVAVDKNQPCKAVVLPSLHKGSVNNNNVSYRYLYRGGTSSSLPQSKLDEGYSKAHAPAQDTVQNTGERESSSTNVDSVTTNVNQESVFIEINPQTVAVVQSSTELESLFIMDKQDLGRNITWDQAAQALVNLGNIRLGHESYGRYFFRGTDLYFVSHGEYIQNSASDAVQEIVTVDEGHSKCSIVNTLRIGMVRQKDGKDHYYISAWDTQGNTDFDCPTGYKNKTQSQDSSQDKSHSNKSEQSEGPTPGEAAELRQQQEEAAAEKKKVDRIAKGMKASQQNHQEGQAFAQQNNAEHKQHLGSRVTVFAKAAPICNDIINGCWLYDESDIKLLNALSIENWLDTLNGFRSPVDFFNVSYFWRFHNFRHAAQQVEGKDGSKPFEQWAEAAYVLIQQDPAYSKCWQEIPNNARDFICTKGKELYQKNKMLQSQRALNRIDVKKLRTKLNGLIQQTQARLDRNQYATFPGSEYQKDHDKELVKALQAMLDRLPSKRYTKEDVGGIDEQEAYQQVAMERLAIIGAGSHDLLCVGGKEHRDLFHTLLVKDGLGIMVRLLGIKGDAQRAVESVCKQALGHFRQGKDALERGDIQLATQHIEKMHTLLSYGQYIETARPGKPKYGYNDKTIDAIASECGTKHDAVAQSAHSLPRACREQCAHNCENALLHFIQREQAHDVKRYKTVAELVGKLAHDRTVVTKVYALSKAVKEAIQKNGYQASMFESCTGHEYDQSLHDQTLQLFESATLLGSSPLGKMLNALVYESIQARLQGDPLKAQRLINLGREMFTFVPITDAVTLADACKGNLSPEQLSQEQLSVEGQKIVQQVRDFVDRAERFGIGVAHGVSHGVQGACDIVIHPINSGQKLLTGMGSLAFNILRMGFDQDILMHPEQYPSQMYQDALERVNTRYTMITACADHLVDSIQNMKAEDLGEFIGRFGTDCLTGELSIFGISKLGMASKVLYNAAKESGHFAQAGERLLQEYGTVCNKLEQLEVKCAQALNKAKTEAEVVGTGSKVGVEAMEAEQVVGKEVAKASESKPAQEAVKRVSKQKRNLNEWLNDIPAACAQLDSSIGDIKTIEKLVTQFKDVKGAVENNGPIAKILQTIEQGASPGNVANAKGALRELETALEATQKGKTVIAFGSKKRILENGKLRIIDVDIETTTSFIESKSSINLSPKTLEELKEQLSKLKKTALNEGKTLELYTKNPLETSANPNTIELCKWLNEQNITFFPRG